MKKKENQRITLTKMLLKKSLIELMETKPITKISVTELCNNAGINRVTFYNHYGCPSDLLREMEADLTTELHTDLSQHVTEYIEDGKCNGKLLIDLICTFFKNNKEVSELIFKNNSADSDFAANIFQIPTLWDDICVYLDKIYGKLKEELLMTSIVNGLYYMIKKWLLDGCKISPQEMGEIANIFILKGFN